MSVSFPEEITLAIDDLKLSAKEIERPLRKGIQELVKSHWDSTKNFSRCYRKSLSVLNRALEYLVRQQEPTVEIDKIAERGVELGIIKNLTQFRKISISKIYTVDDRYPGGIESAFNDVNDIIQVAEQLKKYIESTVK